MACLACLARDCSIFISISIAISDVIFIFIFHFIFDCTFRMRDETHEAIKLKERACRTFSQMYIISTSLPHNV